MNTEFERPGGRIEHRPLHFFWVVDCSSSMRGEKIQTVNKAIKDVIPYLKEAAQDNPSVDLLVRTLVFSNEATWITQNPVPIDEYEWEDIDAYGSTSLGKAFYKLAEQLDISNMPSRGLRPIIVLLSDGEPTDEYLPALKKMKSSPWGKKAEKIAIVAMGDINHNVLKSFTEDDEKILKAENSQRLIDYIKWASTTFSQVANSLPIEKNDNDNNMELRHPQAIINVGSDAGTF